MVQVTNTYSISDIERLWDIIEEFKQSSHLEHDDCFYSCPQSEYYCGSRDDKECNCGLEKNNKLIEEALDIVKSLL